MLIGLLLGETLLTGIFGSAESAHELGVGLEVDNLELQNVLNGFLQTVVLRAAAGQSDAVGGTGLLGDRKSVV